MTSSRRVRPRWVFGPNGFSSASCRSSRCGWLSPWPWGLYSEVLPSSSRSVARQPFDRHNPTAPARRPSSRRRTDESVLPRDRSAHGVEKLDVSFHDPLALLLVAVERPPPALCDAAEDDAVRARHHVQSVSLRYERGLTRRGDRLDDGAVWEVDHVDSRKEPPRLSLLRAHRNRSRSRHGRPSVRYGTVGSALREGDPSRQLDGARLDTRRRLWPSRPGAGLRELPALASPVVRPRRR